MVSIRKKIREQTGEPKAPQTGTHLAAGSSLEGAFSFSGPTVIACDIIGNVKCDELLVLERTARIKGDITASNLIIHGFVRGEVRAENTVELGVTSDVEGKIIAPGLKVAEGAQCRASMEITKAPIVPEVEPAPQGHNVTRIEQASPAGQQARQAATPAQQVIIPAKVQGS